MPSTPAGRRAASAHIDLADARLGLRVLHVYVTVGEVDVANVYSAQFGVAEPGASEAGDDRAPRADPAPGFLLGVVDRRGWNDSIWRATSFHSKPWSRKALAAAPRSSTFRVTFWSSSSAAASSPQARRSRARCHGNAAPSAA